MQKYTLGAAILVLVISLGLVTGCDNRSQLEKDADKAASDVQKALQ